MSLFSRAYSAAIKRANCTVTQAAALSGLSQPSVSRIVSGASRPDPENLTKLFLAIPLIDRLHCLRQYLLDHTPKEYQVRLTLSFSDEIDQEPLDKIDDLASALRFLDSEATFDAHLRTVILELARSFSGRVGESVSLTPAKIEEMMVESASGLRKSLSKNKDLSLLKSK
jgi:transcriptional regulator with XRE-family HTH domain